jgi:predicted dehydrogenase
LQLHPFILPSHIWAAKGDASPNNRINVAIIGPGKMGRGHAHKLIRNPRAQVTGIAEIAEIRTKHTVDLIEKQYSRNAGSEQWKGLKVTKDYLELLEDKSLDAVLIATP